MNQAGLVPGFWGGGWGRDYESDLVVSCETGNVLLLLSVNNVHASHLHIVNHILKPAGVFKRLFGLYTINH